MGLAYALTFFCDAMLYYGALGCMGLLFACRADLFLVPLVLLASCWLSGRLTGRGRWWLRWLPMAGLAPALLVAGNWPGRLASLPMLVYLPLYIENNRRAPDYDYAAERFRHSLIAAGAALLLAALFRAKSWPKGLPWLFIYFTLNMTLLRLLRHDDSVARSARFRLINLGGVALVCAAGFGLSQPGIVAWLKRGWLWFAENVLLNLAALVMYAVQWVLYLLSLLLSPLLGRGGDMPAELPTMPGGDGQPMMRVAADEVRALPPIVLFLLKAVGVALLSAAVFFALRALSRRVGRIQTPSGTDERVSLDDDPAPSAPRGPRLGLAPEDGVRRQYRRALALIRARGGRLSPTMNTRQIQDENAATVDEAAMRALRGVYLPVRYGARQATREDVRLAREAYEQMKAKRRGSDAAARNEEIRA